MDRNYQLSILLKRNQITKKKQSEKNNQDNSLAAELGMAVANWHYLILVNYFVNRITIH